jgi:hypothetical protein
LHLPSLGLGRHAALDFAQERLLWIGESLTPA